MAKIKTFDFDTLSNHAGQRPDKETGSRAVPIYQTASYVFRDSDAGAAMFNIERGGHVYSRISNPTTAVLEERISALEGGVGAVATSSGQAAVFNAIATLVDQGGHIVSSYALYGGTHNLMEYTLPRFGITTTFVDPNDIEGLKKAIKPETRLIFGETVANPKTEVLNIPEVAQIAHDNHLPLVVDSTTTTPYLIKPFDLGADIVVHSATKFLSGHGTSMAGLIVDGGVFDWESTDKFPQMTEKYAGFHNLSFTDHDLAKELFPKGSTAVFSFGIKGGRDIGQVFIDRLDLFSNLANIGDAKSLVIHPASTTHQRMTTEALEEAGISEGLIRLSIGIESVDDLIEDLDKGFRAASKALKK